MATNLDLDPDLLDSAVAAGKHPSKRAAVEAALVEYVNRRKQQEILTLFGEVEFDDRYDYKEARRKPCES
ncbi:MAG: type II toxin-antitoxin system VapB family antitoxin [Verrucomicrobiota bacterium]